MHKNVLAEFSALYLDFFLINQMHTGSTIFVLGFFDYMYLVDGNIFQKPKA
jgi:hypothetical protein